MKVLFKRLSMLLLALLVLIPFTAVSVLADESSAEESSMSEEEMWEKVIDPAYMSAGYTNVAERIFADGESGVITSMQLMVVDHGYAIYADIKTGEIVCLKLAEPVDGEYQVDANGIYKYDTYWSSNPYNAGSSKTANNASTATAIKQQLYSQVIIKYTENDKETTFTGYADGAMNGQINTQAVRGGVRVEYTLGREEIRVLVPRQIRVEKMDTLLAQMVTNAGGSSDPQRFMSFYSKKDANDETLTQATRDEMKVSIPITKKFAVYVCDPGVSQNELYRIEAWVKKYTTYTFEQMDEDHAETEYVSNDKTPPLFKLALEYTLDEYGLNVNCSAGNIRFDSSVYKLEDVIMLPYAGAGDVGTNDIVKDGYAITPDGSGALIDFSDVKGTTFTVSDSLYGQDLAFHTISGANKEVMRLPIYGLVQEDVEIDGIKKDIGYLAIVTDGESLARVTVANGGALHMFMSAYTQFNPRPKDSYMLSGGISAGTNAMWTVESKRKYAGFFSLKIFLLGGEEASYSGMAAKYREYLSTSGEMVKVEDDILAEMVKYILDGNRDSEIEKLITDCFSVSSFDELANDIYGYLKAKPDSAVLDVILEYITKNPDSSFSKAFKNEYNIPLYIETFGSVETTKRIAGVPVDTKLPLTTFEGTVEMLKKLQDEEGIDNINLKLTGWANGGMKPTVPSGVEIEKVIGDEEGFKDLIAYAKENSVGIYPDFDFVFSHVDKNFDGFSPKNDLAKTIDDRNAFKKEYEAVFQAYVDGKLGVISPNKYMYFYDKTYEDYKEYNVGGISVSTLGASLSSDFNKDDPLNREDSKVLVNKLLKKIKEENQSIMLSGGNAYSFKYADHILDIPLDDSKVKYTSASIPFIGMVLHGYVDFAGSAINLAGDFRYMLLKTIENGASPYFILAMENTSELKQYPELSKYYSVRYSIWYRDMVDTYKELNTALSDVHNKFITKHEFVNDNKRVVKVTFEDTVFFINYLLEDYTVEFEGKEYVVKAEDYIKFDAAKNLVE